MGAFNAVDLENLPPPNIIEPESYESILEGMKADLIAKDSTLAPAMELESEPLVKLLQVCAYREFMLRQRINDASRSIMLAYATGANLDHLASLFGIARQVTQIEIDGEQVNQYEDDNRLRHRVQLSLEGHSTAGSKGSYVFWGLSASPKVKDIEVLSPEPGKVNVTVLSTEGRGQATNDLVNTVDKALNSAEVRPLTDHVTVQSAGIVEYEVDAELEIYEGPDQETIRQNAQNHVTQYVVQQHRLGENIYRSGLLASLHQTGVKWVVLNKPAADVDVTAEQAAFCKSVVVTRGEA